MAQQPGLRRVRKSDHLTNTSVRYGNCSDCGRYGRIFSTTRKCADDSRVPACIRRTAKAVARAVHRGQAETTVIPDSQPPCPECNDMGEVWYMDSGPNCDEHSRPCGTCTQVGGTDGPGTAE